MRVRRKGKMTVHAPRAGSTLATLGRLLLITSLLTAFGIVGVVAASATPTPPKWTGQSLRQSFEPRRLLESGT